MTDSMNRRDFLKKSALVGATAVAGGKMFSGTAWAGQGTDISVVSGADYYKSTKAAIKALGGMGGFVKKGAKVALLPNVQRWNPGTFTKPGILRAVIQMCKEVGAAEVNVLSWLGERNWESTGLSTVIKEEGASLKMVPREEALYKTIPVPGGMGMKDVMIMKEFFNNDVFIDMPITKDHAGNKFTGTMKNLMGLNFATHNRSNFHKENWTSDPDAIRHLENCIVDLNVPIKPNLCVVDATEFIITNGPMGPGEVVKPQKVIAGTDRVALDTFCTTLWDIRVEDIICINEAHKRGLGNMDLSQATIKKLQI
jgi:uncharacterized protein (DUF362 family)